MWHRLKQYIVEWLVHEPPYEGVPLCDFERIRYEIRPSDVLLIEGRSRVAESIKQVTQSPWTHACIYLGRLHDIDDPELRKTVQAHFQGDPNEQLVIESYLGLGTIVGTLSQYQNEHIRVCRPKGLSRVDAQTVLERAISHLGHDYDLRQIFDLWRFMVPWSVLPRRFRSSLFAQKGNPTARTVCSTMITEAFTQVNFPILPIVHHHNEYGYEMVPQNAKMMTPKDFDYSPYFEILKFPFLEYGSKGYYHTLPWKRDRLEGVDPTEVLSEPVLHKKKPPHRNLTHKAIQIRQKVWGSLQATKRRGKDHE